MRMLCVNFRLESVRGFFNCRSSGWGRTPQRAEKVLKKSFKKTLLNSSICNSSAWREEGKRGCLLQGQLQLSRGGGKEAKKSFCFNLFKRILFQIAAGLFAGRWFSMWVYQFQGTSVCAVWGICSVVWGFFVNSWICVKSFVNTICRHCQRAFGSSKDFLWRGDTTSIKVAAQVPGWVSLQRFFTVASGVPCLLSVPLSARLLSRALQEMSNNQVFSFLISAPELALEQGSKAPVRLAPGWCSLLGLRWLGLFM